MADIAQIVKAPITVEDLLNSRMIAYPFGLSQCCLVTDGGGALIPVAADRAHVLRAQEPGYLRGVDADSMLLADAVKAGVLAQGEGPVWVYGGPSWIVRKLAAVGRVGM